MNRPNARRVLVVDDNLAVREAVVALLASEGYDAVGVNHGWHALNVLRAEAIRPCVILLDVAMPVMDGFAFRAAQLCDEELAAIPVIVLSGASGPALTAAVAALRAAAGITKPFDADELLRHVATHCRPSPS